MKRFFATILAAAIVAIGAYSISADKNTNELVGTGFPKELDGTMMPYDFSKCDTAVPWGDSLQPVYVNYVARHGARFLSSENKIDKLRKKLLKARSEGRLTDKGTAFLDLIHRVDSTTDGRWGALNACGIAEEQRLGDELAKTCPRLLKYGRVEARATYVPRVVMTMYQFCHSLARYSSKLEISAVDGLQFNHILRFFETDTDYIRYLSDGPWKYAYDSFYEKTVPVRPASLLTDEVTDADKLRDMTMKMYAILQSLRAAGLQADASQWFSEEEYRRCWEVSNLKHYYQRSANSFSDIPAQAAAPLLDSINAAAKRAFDVADMAAGSDGAVGGRNPLRASLWFGHAETVMPLFALMRLPGCYAPDALSDRVADVWKDQEVSPLGANLLIVYLRSNTGRRYAALRLNGRWMPLSDFK